MEDSKCEIKTFIQCILLNLLESYPTECIDIIGSILETKEGYESDLEDVEEEN